MNKQLTIEIIYNECDLSKDQINEIIEGAVRILHKVGDSNDERGPYVLSGIAKCELVYGA